MLQRAASNACSWWWASHIRTKQSKWLEQSLQDMEEKVHSMLKLIEGDGDSFAKRAEMYYKRRPELINAVEESYRAFKSLADRYDLLSKEMQNANHTIGTIFPEQVHFSIEDVDDDCHLPPPPVPSNVSKSSLLQQPINNIELSIPKAPNAPVESLKKLITTPYNMQFQVKKPKEGKTDRGSLPKSGLSKDEALVEINRAHKEILTLQTEKEFVKSSYEGALAKYWEMESQIEEMQEKVSRLQDEFDVEMVIEDSEARTLMAEAALKSCEQTLSTLLETQESFAKEAREECKKIESARKLLNSIRHEDQTNEHVSESAKDHLQPQGSFDKNLDLGSSLESLTVPELAEKIDELVNKVISLETAVSSQSALINTLRTEAEDLHGQILTLEGKKETLTNDMQKLMSRVKELEEKLSRIEELNKNLESQNNSLQADFAQARSCLGCLSEKLISVKPDEEVGGTDSPQGEQAKMAPESKFKDKSDARNCDKSIHDTNKIDEAEGSLDIQSHCESSVPKVTAGEEVKVRIKKSVTFLNEMPVEHVIEEDSKIEPAQDKEKDLSWQQMLLHGTDERERILLQEYTEILKNYKDVKKKLQKEKDSQFNATLQIKELKEVIMKKDHVIQSLHQGKADVKEADASADQCANSEPGSEALDDKENLNTADGNREVDWGSSATIVEGKLQMNIDAILDENMDFWLRFSTAYHEVQKFKSQVQDLQDEILKLGVKKKHETSTTVQLKSEARPHYKHLREIQTELIVWLEQSTSLRDELQRRYASLCNMQDEITKSLQEDIKDAEIRFTSHQAAKLQGEILNMKQENNKVSDELETSVDHVRMLQDDVEKALKQLNEEFGVSSDRSSLQQSLSKARIPLRSFIFGAKPKKHRHSLFSFMHPNRKLHVVQPGADS